ncbi:type IV pilus assembly protein PilM [Jatrophihabitans sp. DSM 45814]
MRHRQTGLAGKVGITNSDGHTIGIDIGATAVRAAIISHGTHEGRPAVSVHGLGQAWLPPGAVTNGVVNDQAAVTRALKQIWAEHRFECRNVILGVTNAQVIVRDLAVPNLSPDQRAKALPYQAREVIPIPLDQALIDFTPLGPPNPDTDTIPGLLVATPRGPVLAAVQAAERAGLHVARVDLSTFAALRSIAHENLAVEAVVDIGAHLTNIVIHNVGVPRVVRTIVRGGQELSDRLIDRANLSPGDAEAAKAQVGLLQGNREVSDLLAEGIRPLLAEIRSSIHYFGSSNPGVEIQRVSLTGGTSSMPGFAAALGEHLAIETSLIEPMQHIRNRWANKDTKAPEAQLAASAVSVGLAMGAAA